MGNLTLRSLNLNADCAHRSGLGISILVPVLFSERYRRALIVLVAIVAVYAVGGCGWGLLIPTKTATVEGGYLSTDPTKDRQEFTGFILLVCGLFILSMVSSLIAWRWAPRSRGPVMIWVVTLVAVLGGVVFTDLGNIVASTLHPLPDTDDIQDGSRITWAVWSHPGAALVVPPLVGSLTYWCAAVLGKGDFPDD